jgi:KaiC/GvpD/RAD55 family RecA-like ATPase
MKTAQEMICSRDQSLEQNVLCEVLLQRRIPLDVTSNLFEGAEKKLFEDAAHMYRYQGQVDSEVLRGRMPQLVEEVLNRAGTYSRPAIEELLHHAKMRATGLALVAFLQHEDLNEGIRTFQSELSSIVTNGSQERYCHEKVCSEALTEIQDRISGNRDVVGYRCSLSGVDNILRGFQHGKAYYVGALKKTGKSRFMTFLASQFLAQGAKVLVNSLEMGARDLAMLRLSYYAGMDVTAFANGTTRAQLDALGNANSFMVRKPWYVCRRLTIEELRAEIAHQKVNGGCDVAFVDFIQMMRSPIHKGDRVREVESIARGLADLARSENVAVVALTQLSGEAERLEADIVPSMRYAKESQAIGECCDWFLSLHNYGRNKSPFDGRSNYIPQSFGIRLEGRYNASGSVAKCTADLRTCRFSDIDMPEDEDATHWAHSR